MGLTVILNGQERHLEAIGEDEGLDRVVNELGLKADRVAVELNGEIARKPMWSSTTVKSGDRLEIVHFVGGG